MSDTVLANARLVLPDAVILGSLGLRDGLIRSIETGGRVPPGAIDCEGDLVLPGLIELHTDNLERHIQPRPGVDWPHAAAILAHDAELAGTGITTVFDALRVGSVVTGPRGRMSEYARALATEIIDLRHAEHLRIDHRLHLRAELCSETLADELDRFGPEDDVGIISLMDHTPGQRQFRDLAQLRTYMQGKHGMSDAEFLAFVAEQREMGDRVRAAHEAAALRAATRCGAALASHDDTTPEQVLLSAAQGVTFAEFPTTLAAAVACRDASIQVMMGAPNLIRGGSHSGNVAAADLAQSGLLDILSSDYVPAALLTAALRLGAIWDDLPRAVACVTAHPARATGLGDRGTLAVGLRADVVRVAPLGPAAILKGTWSRGNRVA
jgi:alpha-D-ribose 1-methylphosphonate 5-triphosphate diphosphatase